MKSLIIGAAGFVGYYLIKELQSAGDNVVCTKLPFEKIDLDNVDVVDLDICNYEQVKDVLLSIKPDNIYHLAAQSSVALSWEKPTMTLNINIIGSTNILEVIRKELPNTKVLLVGSSEEYGRINLDRKINEEDSLNPKNIYALSKATVEGLGKLYSEAYGLNIFMTRSFNHIGPRQLPNFVVADFANQIAKIERNEQEPIIRVGNLESYRDFTDVRDIVRAYRVIMSKSNKGEVYNIGSGDAIKISDILKALLNQSSAKIEVLIDEKKFRPIDIKKIEADVSKIEALGWKRNYNINETITDVLNYYRKLK